MPKPKTKGRVNITVDPAIHQQFATEADRNNQSVSGLLTDMMAFYCGVERLDRPVSPQLLQLFRERLLKDEFTAFQRAVRQTALAAKLKDVNADDSNPDDIRKIPDDLVVEWVGKIGGSRVGVLLAHDFSTAPNAALGRALLWRGGRKLDRVLIVVPFRLAVSAPVLDAAKHAEIEIVGVDALSGALLS